MSTDHCRTFIGPLFIIGMPRSGTKLLRDILNQHSEIGITHIETNFLVDWVIDWPKYGDLSVQARFDKFYQKVIFKTYFEYMRSSDQLIQPNVWYHWCRNFTPGGVFEAIIRHDAGVPYDSGKIWGDKTPHYIRHIATINDLYPQARFIHIIRDVRDYCLSINKAWGKNMIRAAQRWRDDVSNAKTNGKRLGPNKYLEVRYEDLIAETDRVLQKICSFLEIGFSRDLKHMNRPTENLGDAKGLIGIKRDNKEKYITLMDQTTLKKIEAIAASVLTSCGYNVEPPKKSIHINRFKMLYFKCMDGFNLFKHTIERKGFWGAIRWFFPVLDFRR